MCFSAEADFVVAALIAPVGVATLRHVRRPFEVPVAALPLLLAAHQLTEGFVWLGFSGDVGQAVQDVATAVYLAFAQVALPLLVPLGFLLLERNPARRRAMAALAVVGAAVAARFTQILTTNPIAATPLKNAIVYDTDWEFGYVVAAGYVAATCGAPLLASSRVLRVFGIANLVGLGLAAAVRYSAVTSLWCVYAAMVSVLLLAHFRRRPAAALA